ncbi:MAG: c-type cytochrome domain-containing protein [Planctomycetaceae bacterium]
MRVCPISVCRIVLPWCLLCTGTCAGAGQHDVRALLTKYCLGCHGANDGEAGISLVSTDSILAGSDDGPILNRDDLKNSRLFKVLATDADIAMPPEGEEQPSADERAALEKWVLSGATLGPESLARPAVPDVEPRHSTAERLLSSLFLPERNAMAVSGVRTISLLHHDSGESIWQVDPKSGSVAQLSSAHTHPWLAAACGIPGVGGIALILNQYDGSILKQFGGHSDSVYSAVLNHDDSVIATAGYDRKILLHSVETGVLLRTLEGHNGSVFDLAFDPTGTVLCSASADGTVKVWRTSDGERLDTLSQPQAEQYAVLVSPDGRQIYAAGADNRIRVWQLISLQKPQINPLLTARFAHEQAITTLAISVDGSRLASAAEDGTLRVWTTSPLTHLQALPVQSSVVTSACFVSNLELFVTRIDGTTGSFSLPAEAADSAVPATADAPAARSPSTSPDAAPSRIAESEPNRADQAQVVSIPVTVTGTIAAQDGAAPAAAVDTDDFRFHAERGETLLIEVKAERNKSPLDSAIEVLHADGRRVLQTRLQAVRDSYFTFRGKDSDTSDDFRVFNWQEMELNEYLYADGEVVRLWLYPRGPDSGFKVYPGAGNRYTYFGTTPTAHALQAPCFIVVPKDPDEPLIDNGLPVFPVYFENDDDPQREWGHDSRLFFTAPDAGDYLVRLTDARGFSGPDYAYELTIRHPSPDFEVSVGGGKISVAAGTGQEMSFTARRIDGFEGPITISVDNLPEGFESSGPTTIQAEQRQALMIVYATEAAAEPTTEQLAAITITATATINGRQVTHPLTGLEELKLLKDPKIRVRIVAAEADPNGQPDQAARLVIHPGETIPARLIVQRNAHDGIVTFGNEDSGRNLPHGTFVDNIGLNGLMVLEGQTDREFFITAADWVPGTSRTFFLKSNVDNITSLPVVLEVRP